jgi:uncharacterized membrane protein YfhO
VSAAILSQERFQACYDALAASTLELNEFTNTRVSGTISCNRDGLLYTSIPQNGNWFAIVDGEEVETVTVGEAMTAVMLTQGDHEVTFVYRNRAFTYGCMISLGCAALFLALVYLRREKRGGSGRFQKQEA